MQLTCTVCHAHIPLEAALQDAAGRELVAMLADMAPEQALPLVHYLAFFRPAKQQLGWGRSLRLAREVLALANGAPGTLTRALVEAGRALDEKRAAGAWKPLGNHNYLKRVLESLQGQEEPLSAAQVAASRDVYGIKPAPAGKRAAAIAQLEGMKR